LAAGELFQRPGQLFGQGLRAPCGRSCPGWTAGRKNDPAGSGVQCRQIEAVATDGGRVVGQEELEVGDPLGLGSGQLEVGLPIFVIDAGEGDELFIAAAMPSRR